MMAYMVVTDMETGDRDTQQEQVRQVPVRYHAKYVMEIMKMSRTKAPAATP